MGFVIFAWRPSFFFVCFGRSDQNRRCWSVHNIKNLFFKHSRAANSAVQRRICLKFELIQDVMVILVSFKNEEDPIKIEGARVATIQNIDFSNTKGQLTPQSEVGSGRKSNSSEIL